MTPVQITTPSDVEIAVARAFDAPRDKVFKAFVTPKLVSRWMLGPEGWTMPVCEIDAKPGGKFRYVWRHPRKPDMGMSGVFRELKAPERIVHVESFDEAWYPGECVVTTVFSEKGGRTTVTMTMRFESREGRDLALKTGMEQGMAEGYRRLDEILAT